MPFQRYNEILVCRQAFYAPVTNPWDTMRSAPRANQRSEILIEEPFWYAKGFGQVC